MAVPSPSSVTFADLLRHHRVAAGLTQEELAARAQLSVDAISMLGRAARLCVDDVGGKASGPDPLDEQCRQGAVRSPACALCPQESVPSESSPLI